MSSWPLGTLDGLVMLAADDGRWHAAVERERLDTHSANFRLETTAEHVTAVVDAVYALDEAVVGTEHGLDPERVQLVRFPTETPGGSAGLAIDGPDNPSWRRGAAAGEWGRPVLHANPASKVYERCFLRGGDDVPQTPGATVEARFDDGIVRVVKTKLVWRYRGERVGAAFKMTPAKPEPLRTPGVTPAPAERRRSLPADHHTPLADAGDDARLGVQTPSPLSDSSERTGASAGTGDFVAVRRPPSRASAPKLREPKDYVESADAYSEEELRAVFPDSAATTAATTAAAEVARRGNMLLAEQVRMQHARLEREQKSHLDASTTLCSADHVLLRYLASGCGSQSGRVIGMSGADPGMDAGEAYGKQIRKEVRSRAKTAAAGFRFAFTTRIIRDITRCAYGEGFLCPDAIRWATEAQLREMLDMPEDTTLSKLLPLIDNLPEYWNACKALETLIRGAHGEAPAARYKGLYLHVRENMVESKGDRWQLPHAREIMNKACRAFGEGLVEGLADVNDNHAVPKRGHHKDPGKLSNRRSNRRFPTSSRGRAAIQAVGDLWVRGISSCFGVSPRWG